MKLSFRPFELQLKHPFSIASFTRTSTPIMLVELHYENWVGYGEASLVPYLGESIDSATDFLNRLDVSAWQYPFDVGTLLAQVDSIAPNNTAIKAALDIALHDLWGKIENKPCYELLGILPQNMPATCFTIGIDTPENISKKVLEAQDFEILKIKLGTKNDKAIINAVRSVSALPLYADANQGWTDKYQALDMLYWLHEQGVQIIEQPMPRTMIDENAWLTESSPIPTLGDEAVQRLNDVAKAKGVYTGINIKLMKCTGMHEGLKMIHLAKQQQMPILVGCMSETSCATLAGATLAPLCNWVDLDGPFLVSNNPFASPVFQQGRYQLSNEAGLGIKM